MNVTCVVSRCVEGLLSSDLVLVVKKRVSVELYPVASSARPGGESVVPTYKDELMCDVIMPGVPCTIMLYLPSQMAATANATAASDCTAVHRRTQTKLLIFFRFLYSARTECGRPCLRCRRRRLHRHTRLLRGPRSRIRWPGGTSLILAKRILLYRSGLHNHLHIHIHCQELCVV